MQFERKLARTKDFTNETFIRAFNCKKGDSLAALTTFNEDNKKFRIEFDNVLFESIKTNVDNARTLTYL